jgi:hypothetical protein
MALTRVDDVFGKHSAVTADEQMPAVLRGNLVDCLGEHVEVIGGGVGAGVARPQPHGVELTGVVAGHQDWVEPVRVCYSSPFCGWVYGDSAKAEVDRPNLIAAFRPARHYGGST